MCVPIPTMSNAVVEEHVSKQISSGTQATLEVQDNQTHTLAEKVTLPVTSKTATSTVRTHCDPESPDVDQCVSENDETRMNISRTTTATNTTWVEEFTQKP
ncbi:unnamed protein product [Dicrocoelium dendriticum]|nr:unnamed protein product [Dicrocoelium dendriticum]